MKPLSGQEAHRAIQSHCLAKDGAVEDYPWGDVVWKVGGKMFAAAGEVDPHVTVKATLEKQAVLIQHPAIEKAAYVGRYGWVTIHVTDEETLDLACDLIDESYDAVLVKSGTRGARSKV